MPISGLPTNVHTHAQPHSWADTPTHTQSGGRRLEARLEVQICDSSIWEVEAEIQGHVEPQSKITYPGLRETLSQKTQQQNKQASKQKTGGNQAATQKATQKAQGLWEQAHFLWGKPLCS